MSELLPSNHWLTQALAQADIYRVVQYRLPYQEKIVALADEVLRLRGSDETSCDVDRDENGRRKGTSPLTAENLAARLAGARPEPSGSWRENAIRLHKVGYATVVSVERANTWIEVIRDTAEFPSHIVEPSGINACLRPALKTGAPHEP